MEYQVGKRYCISPRIHGQDKWISGVLESLHEDRFGKYAVINAGGQGTWKIYIANDNLTPFERKKQ